MVGYIDAIRMGFQKCWDFSGRSTKPEYWKWFVFVLVGVLILSIVDIRMHTYNFRAGGGLISGLFRVISLIPSLSLGARRLHDINRTGWWQLLLFVPLLGLIVIMILAAKDGDIGKNRYGQDPHIFLP